MTADGMGGRQANYFSVVQASVSTPSYPECGSQQSSTAASNMYPTTSLPLQFFYAGISAFEAETILLSRGMSCPTPHQAVCIQKSKFFRSSNTALSWLSAAATMAICIGRRVTIVTYTSIILAGVCRLGDRRDTKERRMVASPRLLD